MTCRHCKKRDVDHPRRFLCRICLQLLAAKAPARGKDDAAYYRGVRQRRAAFLAGFKGK